MVSTLDALSPKLVQWNTLLTEILDHLEFVYSLCHKRLLEKEEPLMQFSHKSITDFLENPDEAGVFAVDVGLGHMLLVTRCTQVLKSRSELTDPCRVYAVRHLVHHLCYLHKHPYHSKAGAAGPDPLQEAARVLVDFDWLVDRLLLDEDTRGVVEDMKEVSDLLWTRGGDGDADLARCVDVVRKMTDDSGSAVRHDPRQIVGRIVLELSSDTRAPVVNLVKRARQCKRFRWWHMNGDTLTMGGEGPDLTRVGDFAFAGECQGEGESMGDDIDMTSGSG